ncbi:hypothetical protein [Ilumatobacter sp.]|uniref:hypothetical protein n=1 Tax=Ilumatobacter sp. TaxID=1967498 RepID=UPI003B5292D5
MAIDTLKDRISGAVRRARGDALVREEGRSHRSELAQVRSSLSDLGAQVRVLQTTVAELTEAVASTAGGARRAAPVLTAEQGSWKDVAQEGELSFHKRPNIRSGTEWESSNERMWRNFGFEPTGWEDKVVIDVGAGSRLRSLFFEGSKIAVIEPLADQYSAEVEWNDLELADELHSVPAETLVPSLVGTGDLIISINALDHGYEFDQAIGNIAEYVKPTGTVFLSYDEHAEVDELHPLVISDEVSREVFDRHGLAVEDFRVTAGYHPGLGGGALNYWLRKR